MKKLNIGLYGTHYHQLHAFPPTLKEANIMAIAGFDEFNKQKLYNLIKTDVKEYETLGELIADDEVELISLCSPVRRYQAKEAIKCLESGKHVYAEKPCAMTEAELDMIISTSLKTGNKFHEMAGTAWEQPYLTMREIVGNGMVGEVVQVFAQKSYPYYKERPQDEDIDGGLLMQVGVHAIRMIEQVALQKVEKIEAIDTQVGNPFNGDLKMAVSFNIALENGGIASAIANYCNVKAFGSWGNEHLRIFGTNGFVESVDAGKRTRLVTKEKNFGEIRITQKGYNYIDLFVKDILDGFEMPISLEDELHPTRVLIRAREKLK